MGGEKKPLVMNELGCADGCGRQMGAENCAEGCGRRGCNGVAGNGWGEEAAGDERAWLRGRLRTGNGRGEVKPLVMSELGCADGCGREWVRRIAQTVADGVGPRGMAGNGWGEEAAGDERAWLRGRLRTANGMGRMRGRLRTANGWGEWRGVGRIARTVADGVGAREWLEMGGETKALEMRERGCADGCGREMGGENFADGCGRHGCKGVAGNSWGEEVAGDERAWLRGRLRTGNGWGELRGRLRTAWVQRSGWKWVGRRTRCSPRTRMLTRMLMYMQSLRTIFCNSLFEQSCIYIFPL